MMTKTQMMNIGRFAKGAQKITQRLEACKCGCGGRDPWHAAKIRRAVRNIVVLPAPERRRCCGASMLVAAVGEYKHPSGEMRPCALDGFVSPTTGEFIACGWYHTESEEERAARAAKREAERAETDAWLNREIEGVGAVIDAAEEQRDEEV